MLHALRITETFCVSSEIFLVLASKYHTDWSQKVFIHFAPNRTVGGRLIIYSRLDQSPRAPT